MLDVVLAAVVAAVIGASLDLAAALIARHESVVAGSASVPSRKPTPVDHHQSAWPAGRMAVPALAAAGAVASAVRLDDPTVLVTVVPLVCLVTVLAVIDINTRRLPNWLTLPAIPVGVGLVLAATALGAPASRHALTAAAVVALAALAVAWWAPAALGMGDAKLICAMVVLVAPVGVSAVWVAALGGLVLSGLFSAAVMALGRRETGSTIPAGPFLAVGALLAVLLTG